MKKLISILSVTLVLFLVCTALAVPVAVVPIVPTETPNEAGFTTTNGVTGQSIKNAGGDVIILIKNETATSAGVATLTVQDASVSVGSLGVIVKTNSVCTLAAGENCVMGPFNPRFWNDGNSNLQLSYTGDASGAMSVIGIKR